VILTVPPPHVGLALPIFHDGPPAPRGLLHGGPSYIHAGNGRAFSTTPLSYGRRLATMVYGLLVVIESWQLHVSSVTQVLTVLSIATFDSMHVLPIPAEA
jgi:hypothetical protein